uniref:Uncharacterized protein n=1 Tax=Anguilla anguilla TaxID=7936 RepID=A0A0E9WCS1_ANGAN
MSRCHRSTSSGIRGNGTRYMPFRFLATIQKIRPHSLRVNSDPHQSSGRDWT